MGNVSIGATAMTSDNLQFFLGATNSPNGQPNMSGPGQCTFTPPVADFKQPNGWFPNGDPSETTPNVTYMTCKYTSADIQQLMSTAGSKGIITQIITSSLNYIYVYNQDNFQGNKYLIPPQSNFIVPSCFNIKSISLYPYYGNSPTGTIFNGIMIEKFENSEYDPTCTFPIYNINWLLILIVLIIVIIIFNKKKCFG